MGDLTEEEIKAMKAKEAKNRKEKLDNSKIHDAEVIEKYKSMLGLPPEGAPAQAPAPVDPMGNTAGPAPQAGMKKGGSVSSASRRADGCCVKGKTRA